MAKKNFEKGLEKLFSNVQSSEPTEEKEATPVKDDSASDENLTKLSMSMKGNTGQSGSRKSRKAAMFPRSLTFPNLQGISYEVPFFNSMNHFEIFKVKQKLNHVIHD